MAIINCFNSSSYNETAVFALYTPVAQVQVANYTNTHTNNHKPINIIIIIIIIITIIIAKTAVSL
jgi:hypothetical protein